MRTTAAACALPTRTALPAWAGPQCTTADRKQWQNPRQVEQKLKAEGHDRHCALLQVARIALRSPCDNCRSIHSER